MSINAKLLLTIAAILLGLISVAGFTLLEEKSALLEDRKVSTRHVVETAHGVLEHYYARQKSGELSEAQAQLGARNQLKAMRYGDNEYFWINDMRHRMVMHPVKPEMEGQDYTGFKDAKGKLMFGEFVQTVRDAGAGYVEYYWPKPGFAEPVAKISYVKGFEPWGWVLGSGIYLDDVDALFRKNATRLFTSIAAIVLVIGAVLVWGGRRLVARIGAVVTGVNRVAQGDLTVDIADGGSDEIGQLAEAANAMRRQLRDLSAQIDSHAGEVNQASLQIAAAVESQAATSAQMSSSVAEITSTMEELSASSTQIADHSKAVVDIATQTWESSKRGAEAMQLVQGRMEGIRADNQNNLEEIVALGTKSKQISKVMEIINAIADQTKLIAFNAALEASSAGEAGKRFSVVAQEIRRLADSVTDSTGEIEAKVQEIQDSISRLVITSENGATAIGAGMEAAAASAQRLSDLVGAASHTTSAAQQISLSTQQQKSASNQVVVALREIVTASSQTAQSIGRINQVSHEMTGISAELGDLLKRFKFKNV